MTGGLFITGTDTDVGKTAVTAMLAAAWRSARGPITALKPLATGSAPPGDDARLLGLAAGHPPRVHTCLPVPAAPTRAAAEASALVSMESVVQWIRRHPGPKLVEGVGGFRVPLAVGWDVARLAHTLQLPVVIVAANRLGVLSHTLLTVDAVRAQGLAIAGVVLNSGAPRSVEHRTGLGRWNLVDLQAELPDIPVLVTDRVAPRDWARAGAPLLKALAPPRRAAVRPPLPDRCLSPE